MESPAGRAGAEDCHCESAARALWAGSDGRDAKGGHLRASENETGVWRKYLAGGAVRAVGQRAGRNRGAVTGGFAGDERWRVLGGSSRDASSDRASGDCAASRAEQERRDGVPGIRRERQGARDSCAIWVPGGGCWSGAAERTGKEVTRIAGYRTGISRKRKRRMEAMWLSVKLAGCVAAILLVLGMPLAYWLAYTKWRWKFLLEVIVALPLVLPPTVLGFYALVAMGSRGPLGRLWTALFGHSLAFTFSGLVLASVLYSLPFAVQPLIASFESVDGKLLAASAVLGAGKWRTFWRVILPLSMPGVLTAVVLSFAHTMGEFGVVLMVGGNLAGVTRTVSIEIYDHVQSLEYGAANGLALALLVISFVVLALVYGINRRVRRRTWMPWTAE